MSPSRLREAILVFYRYPTPWLLSLTLLGALAVRASLGAPAVGDLAILAGLLLFWPVQEWLIHVFILHFRPFRLLGRRIDLLPAREHRAHHRDPLRIDLVFIPVPIAILGIVLHGLLWNLALPTAALAFTGMATYFALTLHYEWVHYLVHTLYRPRSRYYQRLWSNHRLHHFKNEHFWFGVTMLGGDRILHTAADHAAVPTSPTCRTLGREDDLGAAASG